MSGGRRRPEEGLQRVDALRNALRTAPEILRARLLARATRRQNGCLEWTGARNTRGYGKIKIGRVVVAVHRAAYALANGDIPAGLGILHRCDNPSCIDPDHLFAGSQLDNVRDAMSKGRSAFPPPTDWSARRKERPHHWERLTVEQVVEIKRLLGEGRSKRSLARQFGMSDTAINQIASGKTWAHV